MGIRVPSPRDLCGTPSGYCAATRAHCCAVPLEAGSGRVPPLLLLLLSRAMSEAQELLASICLARCVHENRGANELLPITFD